MDLLAPGMVRPRRCRNLTAPVPVGAQLDAVRRRFGPRRFHCICPDPLLVVSPREAASLRASQPGSPPRHPGHRDRQPLVANASNRFERAGMKPPAGAAVSGGAGLRSHPRRSERTTGPARWSERRMDRSRGAGLRTSRTGLRAALVALNAYRSR